jgi:hypothetical protein
MDLGEEASRAPFLLADKEEEEIGAVASALVAIFAVDCRSFCPLWCSVWGLDHGGDGERASHPTCGLHKGILLAWGWVDFFGPHQGSFSCILFPIYGRGWEGEVWWVWGRNSEFQWCNDVEPLNRLACTW